MRVTYPGPHLSVVIPSARITVGRGETVDLDDDLAAALIAQGWLEPKAESEPSPTPAKKTKE